MTDNKQLLGHPLLSNFPGDIDKDIHWYYMDKDSYLEMENILTDGVKLFDPFLVEDFYPEEMFQELVEICTSKKLEDVDFSHQMNKWEEGINIPQKFIDYAVEKVKTILNENDISFAYHMYAHHQITSEDRVPKLPLHIDWAPGAYMVDLHIGGNRDWGFVARYENFVTKPNQAIICQPQLDYHYRPSWNSNDTDEYYQALFFHLINSKHWCIPNESKVQTRTDDLNSRHNFGQYFRDSDIFINYQKQKRQIFDKLYIKTLESHNAPPIPWDELPSKEDAQVHQRKGVRPKKVDSSHE